MNLYPNPETLALRWQRQSEISYESGYRPLIGLGMDSLQAESILALLALRRLEDRRPARIDPLFVVGGEGALWLLTALLVQSSDRPGSNPAVPVYAGNDPATHAATLNLHAPHASSPLDWGLPAGMAWMLTPTAVPGSERSDLEYLPFALAEEHFVPVAAPETLPTWLDALDSWVALLLALALLLAAWLV